MPHESLDDDESVDLLIEAYDTLVACIRLPITIEEAQVIN